MANEIKKQWFSSSPLKNKGKLRIEGNVIYGVSINTAGEAKGHGVHLDNEFVDKVVEEGNAKKSGLKARFGHPNMCSTALGTFIGRYKNFYRDGGQARADLYLSTGAKTAPGGNLYDYVLDMAENNPDMFGTSIVFTPGKTYKKTADGVKIDPDDLDTENDGKTYTSLEKLHACDVVDDPAANPDGLFSAFNRESFAAQMTEFLDLHPEIYRLAAENPSVISEFLARYEKYQASNNTEKAMSEKEKSVQEDKKPLEAAAEAAAEEVTEEAAEDAPAEAEGDEGEAAAEGEEAGDEEVPAEDPEAAENQGEGEEETAAEEGKEDPRDEFRAMKKEFGAEKAAEYFAEGLDLAAARVKFSAAVVEENKQLKEKLKSSEIEGVAAVDFSEPTEKKKTFAEAMKRE